MEIALYYFPRGLKLWISVREKTDCNSDQMNKCPFEKTNLISVSPVAQLVDKLQIFNLSGFTGKTHKNNNELLRCSQI